MKLRLFLLSIIPYILILIVVYQVSVFFFNKYQNDTFKDIIRQEFNRLSLDITNVLEKEEDYAAIVKAIVGQYRMGSYTYAWLIDKEGNEIAVSQNKKYMEPRSLLFDKQYILPYILKHLPSGESSFDLQPWHKFIKYSELSGTGSVLIIVSSIPLEYAEQSGFYRSIFFSLLALFLAGLLLTTINTELTAEPINKIANYALRVSIEEQPERPRMKADPETELILVSLDRIKKMLSERQVPDLNPITNLPGNYTLEKQLFDAIDSKMQFAVGAVNVYNFSSYNHKYGFKKGDSVIRFMGSTIQSVLQEIGDKEDFVSHLAGDRFVFISKSEKIETICTEIIRRFDAHISLYYDELDRNRGYILSKNRKGEIQKYPIMRITVAVTTNHNRPLIHPLQIAHITSEILDYLKKQEQSSYLIDRRLTDRGPKADGEEKSSPEYTYSEASPVEISTGETIEEVIIEEIQFDEAEQQAAPPEVKDPSSGNPS